MLRLAPFVLVLAACGGGDAASSGVDSSKKLTELNATERQQLCEYMVEVEGGANTSKMCGDGVTITVKSATDCTSTFSQFEASCTATVANAEACADAAGEDLCNLVGSSSCAFLFQCL